MVGGWGRVLEMNALRDEIFKNSNMSAPPSPNTHTNVRREKKLVKKGFGRHEREESQRRLKRKATILRLEEGQGRQSRRGHEIRRQPTSSNTVPAERPRPITVSDPPRWPDPVAEFLRSSPSGLTALLPHPLTAPSESRVCRDSSSRFGPRPADEADA